MTSNRKKTKPATYKKKRVVLLDVLCSAGDGSVTFSFKSDSKKGRDLLRLLAEHGSDHLHAYIWENVMEFYDGKWHTRIPFDKQESLNTSEESRVV